MPTITEFMGVQICMLIVKFNVFLLDRDHPNMMSDFWFDRFLKIGYYIPNTLRKNWVGRSKMAPQNWISYVDSLY